jgi:hypothetical protein
MEDETIDPIDIILEDEAPENEPVVIDTGETPPTPEIIEPEKGIEALKKRLEAEQNARIEAEMRAQAEADRAYRAQSEVQSTQLHMIANSIDSYRQNAEVLKANYAAAMENGDYGNAASIQEAMARNSAELLQLEQGRDALQSAPKPERPVYQPPVHADPVEAFAAQCTPRSADWVRSHPEYVTNPALQQQMFAAHQFAVASGNPVDTPAYFAAVERVLGIEGQQSAPRTQQRYSAPPAAPVSRAAGGGGSARSTHITLTAAQREAAAMSGMTDKEYARTLIQMRREGRVN